jgi:hypothetical protein
MASLPSAMRFVVRPRNIRQANAIMFVMQLEITVLLAHRRCVMSRQCGADVAHRIIVMRRDIQLPFRPFECQPTEWLIASCNPKMLMTANK